MAMRLTSSTRAPFGSAGILACLLPPRALYFPRAPAASLPPTTRAIAGHGSPPHAGRQGCQLYQGRCGTPAVQAGSFAARLSGHDRAGGQPQLQRTALSGRWRGGSCRYRSRSSGVNSRGDSLCNNSINSVKGINITRG
jgi:hypothetical protein